MTELNPIFNVFRDFADHKIDENTLQKRVKELEFGTRTVSIAEVNRLSSNEVSNNIGEAPRDSKKVRNNDIRRAFYNSIVQQFGGDAKKIPQSVLGQMKLEDYGGLKKDALAGGVVSKNEGADDGKFNSGKRLSHSRITTVLTAMEEVIAPRKGKDAFQEFKNSMGDKPRQSLKDGVFNAFKKMGCDFNKDYRMQNLSLSSEKFKSEFYDLMDEFEEGIFSQTTYNKSVYKTIQNEFLLYLFDKIKDKHCPKGMQNALKSAYNSFIDHFHDEFVKTKVNDIKKNVTAANVGEKVQNYVESIFKHVQKISSYGYDLELKQADMAEYLETVVSDLYGADMKNSLEDKLKSIAAKLSTPGKQVDYRDGMDEFYELLQEQNEKLEKQSDKELYGLLEKAFLKCWQKTEKISPSVDGESLARKFDRIVKGDAATRGAKLQTFLKSLFNNKFKSLNSSEDSRIMLQNMLTQIEKTAKSLVGSKDSFNNAKAQLQKFFDDCVSEVKDKKIKRAKNQMAEAFMRNISFAKPKPKSQPPSQTKKNLLLDDGEEEILKHPEGSNAGEGQKVEPKASKGKEAGKIDGGNNNGARLSEEGNVSNSSQSVNGKSQNVEKNELLGTDAQKISSTTTQPALEKGPTIKQYEEKLDTGLKKATSALNKVTAFDIVLKECLKDEKFLEECANLKFDIETGNDFFERRKDLVEELNDENIQVRPKALKFKRFQGYSTDAAQSINAAANKSGKPAKIFMSVFADHTGFGGQLLQDKTSQEESTLRDFGLVFIGHLVATKKVTVNYTAKGKPEFLPYAKGNDGKSLGPAHDGYTVTLPQLFNNLQPLGDTENNNVVLQFRAAGSLQGDGRGNDIGGDTEYMVDNWEKEQNTQGISVSDDDREKARVKGQAFMEELYSQAKVPTNITQAQFEEACLLFMSGKKNTAFDVFGKNTKAEVTNLLSFVKNGKIKDGWFSSSKAKYVNLVTDARDTYYNSIRMKIRQDIIKAREEKATHFVCGALGCGAFANDVYEIAKIYAEEFCKHGGEDMEFVFPEKGANATENAEAFEDAFNKYASANGIAC